MQRIDANSKHLATLINDVLDIERIEAGRMPLQISQFPVQDVVREVMEELQGVIAQSTGDGQRDAARRPAAAAGAIARS